MKNLVLVPDALMVAAAIALLLDGRLGFVRGRARRFLPGAAVFVALVAFLLELWAGSAVNTYFGGALVQYRFALFAQAAVLFTATLALSATDWQAEDSR